MSTTIYVHIPFCVSKCNYCDFTSVPIGGMDAEKYIQALGQELAMYADETAGLTVSTLYIGGGTPSILTEKELECLFGLVRENFRFESGAEVSMEANPGTVTSEKLKLLKRNGVNRLSLGVQSFDDNQLKKLGRIHTACQAVEAFELARGAGFENINLDLMHGLPGQDGSQWDESLRKALNLRPEHLSVYGLIIEPETPFGRAVDNGNLSLPEEEDRAEMYELTREVLSSNGYNQYEISNYARPGFESRHNKVYWNCGQYLGFGAGAASYWGYTRRTNHSNINRYIEEVLNGFKPVGEQEELNAQDKMAEYMFLGLRMLDGVSFARFKETFGFELQKVYTQQINKLCCDGLLHSDEKVLKLTEKGILLANQVFIEFI